MFDIIVAVLALVGLFTITLAAFVAKIHIDNIVTIEMNKKAAERDRLAAASRIN